MIAVKISADALQDLNDGFLFYEAQESGLGDYLVTCLRADIEGLRVVGGTHRVVYRDYRRLLSKVIEATMFVTGAVVPVWTGLKPVSNDPTGQYTRLAGCDPTATLTVEAQ